MGGIMMLVFGSIAVVWHEYTDSLAVDVTEARNPGIISVVMSFGIGGMFVNFGEVSLKALVYAPSSPLS